MTDPTPIRIEKRPVWRCERCTHEWTALSETVPTVCPKCHSAYWAKPKIVKGGDE